jgi:rhodanese-related sulfurtransferase
MPDPFEIDPVTLSNRLEDSDSPVILDVREPWEIEIGAVDGALSIPLGELPRRVGEVPHDRQVAVMCHHGGRSAQATAWLRNQGFEHAVNVTGGIDAWSRLVDPTVSRY